MRNAVRRREKHSFRTVFGASFKRAAASSTVKRSRKNATLADGILLFSALIGMSHIMSSPRLARAPSPEQCCVRRRAGTCEQKQPNASLPTEETVGLIEEGRLTP
jgi:hypothetical protein